MRFYSTGCLNDRDCAVNITGFYPVDKAQEMIKGYPFNFQECRNILDGGSPDDKSREMNGCLCTNYLTSAEMVIDDNGIGYVTCTNVDSASRFFFVIQGMIAFIHFFIALSCLFIFVYYFKGFVTTMHYQTSRLCGASKSTKTIGIGSIKMHSLIAILYLYLSTSSYAVFKACIIYSYATSAPDLASPPAKQLRVSDYTYDRLNAFAHCLFELCALHFTVIWMSSTPKIFLEDIDNDESSRSWFKPLWYKRFIYFSEICIIIPILALFKDPINDIYVIEIVAGLLLIYEFGWGCKHISKRLRIVASKLTSPPVTSSAAVKLQKDESDASKKLIEMADRIDRLSKIFGRFGLLCIAIYLPYLVVFDIMKMGVSASTATNAQSYIRELGNVVFTILEIVLFDFLLGSLFRKSIRERKTNLFSFKRSDKKSGTPAVEVIPYVLKDDKNRDKNSTVEQSEI